MMSRKTRQAYVNRFWRLKDGAAQRDLQLVMEWLTMDFVSGLALAIAAEFPDAVHNGCFLQTFGLQQLYRTNKDARNLVC